jgi:diguanylate cyclase (GGDEF)-like protein/PAS domain S-box-containing protein
MKEQPMPDLLSIEDQGDDDASSPTTILLVEDEPRLRAIFRRLLGAPDRRILEAGTVAEGRRVLEQETPDVALLDIGLPDASGLDLLRWIRRERPQTTVIMVSADAHIDSAIRALREGAADFVRKDTDIDLLPVKVADVLDRRRLAREHRRINERLARSERLHRFLVDNSPDLVYALDTDGRFVFANDRTQSLLGVARTELLGQPFSALVEPEDRHLAEQVMRARRDDGSELANFELRLRAGMGARPSDPRSEPVFVLVSAIAIREADRPDAPLEGSYGVARNITERKRLEQEMNFQALHDQLTGLPNRRLFREHLDVALANAARRKEHVAVMFIDLDRFKLVNDTYGHLEGDELLRACAQRIRECVRAGDTVSRMGGDEFTVLLPGLKETSDAMLIAAKITAELRRPFRVAGREFFVTASIGIAIHPGDGEAAEQLLRNADTAMYEVKAQGKNAARLFSTEMRGAHLPRLELERDLRRALPNDEFVLHFQPQYSVFQKRVIGAEALIRWRHPQHGLMLPGSFIELAEETGLMGMISEWVIEEACRQLASWQDGGLRDMRVSINLSPHEFSRPELVALVASAIERFRIPRDALEIEITENVLLQDVAGVVDKLRELRRLGIRISIDDFGTRYSSLNYLRSFPINAIKIDQSFIRDIHDEETVSPIVVAIVGIAKGFDLGLIAEGVETDLQRRVLARLGCDEMQGYLFGRPTAAADSEIFRGWQQQVS